MPDIMTEKRQYFENQGIPCRQAETRAEAGHVGAEDLVQSPLSVSSKCHGPLVRIMLGRERLNKRIAFYSNPHAPLLWAIG